MFGAIAPAAWQYWPRSFAPHPSSATSPLIAALAHSRNASVGAALIKFRKYGHEFRGFTGFRIDLLQSVHQSGVFGPELVEQRIGLFVERLERLVIILLRSLFDLIVELG